MAGRVQHHRRRAAPRAHLQQHLGAVLRRRHAHRHLALVRELERVAGQVVQDLGTRRDKDSSSYQSNEEKWRFASALQTPAPRLGQVKPPASGSVGAPAPHTPLLPLVIPARAPHRTRPARLLPALCAPPGSCPPTPTPPRPMSPTGVMRLKSCSLAPHASCSSPAYLAHAVLPHLDDAAKVRDDERRSRVHRPLYGHVLLGQRGHDVHHVVHRLGQRAHLVLDGQLALLGEVVGVAGESRVGEGLHGCLGYGLQCSARAVRRCMT